MVRQLLITVGAPVVLTSAVLLVAVFVYRYSDSWRPVERGGSIGFGLSFFVAYCLVNGAVPAFPPGDSVSWLPYIAIAAAILGLIELEDLLPRWSRWGLRIVLSGIALFVTLRPILQYHITTVEAILLSAGGIAGISVTWWLVEQLDEVVDGFVIPLTYLFCSASAGVLLLTVMNYGSMAQVAGSFSAITGVLVVFSAWDRSRSVVRGVFPCLMILFPVLLLSGWFFASGGGTGSWPFLLLGVVPVVIWVSRVPFCVDSMSRLQQGGVSVTTVLALALTVSLVVHTDWRTAREDGKSFDQTDRTNEEEADSNDEYGY